MVPNNLRRWFVLHFIVDMIFALPLLLFPDRFLALLELELSNPLVSRLVGAALLGIGLGGFVTRHADAGAFIAMLNIKIIWSLGAVFGILVSMISGGPYIGWLILALFVMFAVVWIYYRLQISTTKSS